MAEHDVEASTPAGKWAQKIRNGLKVEEDWRKQAEESVQRYREEDELKDDNKSRFNILYANISVLRPSIYQHAPRPDVRRRYDPRPILSGDQQADQQAKLQSQTIRKAASDASDIIERSLSVSIDQGDFETEAGGMVDDMLLPGRGAMRYRYEAITNDQFQEDEAGNRVKDEDDKDILISSEIVQQRVWGEYVYWKDFTQAPGRRWSKHDLPAWIAFRHLPNKDELQEFFPGKDVSQIKFDWTSEDGKEERERLGEADRAELWEIWDKDKRKINWIAMDSENDFIHTDDFPFDLEEVYPMPPPIYGVKTNDTLAPVSEHEIYKDLSKELDIIQERITTLTRMVKVAGAFSGDQDVLALVMDAKDGEMEPIENFQTGEGNTLESSFWFWPINTIIQVIAQLYIQREQIKQTIFEVVGISDILRGASNPNETLGAQRIKTQFGTLKIDAKRRNVDRNLRDGLRIMGEIIAEKFEKNVLQKMTGIEVSDGALAVLRDEGMRGFLIDIESDSTVAPDEIKEQEAVTKLLVAVSTFFQAFAPLVQDGTLTGEEALQILKFAIRPFRGARNLEETIEKAERRLLELAQNPPEEEDPDAAANALELEIKQIEREIAEITGRDEIRKSELQVDLQILKNQQQRSKNREGN